MRNGRGDLTYSDQKSNYKGQFQDDVRHGKGILYLDAEKYIYIGDFKNDQKDGQGVATRNGKEIHNGKWNMDEALK